MANTSVPTSHEEATTRIERGRRLYAEHSSEIPFEPVEKLWLVPSQHEATAVYQVHLGREEVCECSDFEHRHPSGGCKHIVATTLHKAKTFRCKGCRERFPNSELVEVMDTNHLTFFEGDPLCEDCARAHGLH